MYKRVLTIQDISCVGQCSLTVALPIISSFGIETSILPSSILSTHTMGFKNYTYHDLSSEFERISNHWEEENIRFDGIYTGYLGKIEEIDYILKSKDKLFKEGSPLVVDPVMADFGKLYPGFDDSYVSKMRELCIASDIIIPNLTEACLLTNIEYKESYDESYILSILNALKDMGCKTSILTGITYNKGKTGVVVFDTNYKYYSHKYIEKSFHGTGDVYSSCFFGYYLKHNDLFKAAKLAANFTLKCIEETIKDESHTYGVEFEKLLHLLS